MERSSEENICANCIYKSYLFDNLTDKEMGMLSTTKKELSVEQGEVIIREGDKIEKFVYLKSGLVKLHKIGKDGRDHIISMAISSDFVGLLTSFAGNFHNYSISALSKSEICAIDVGFMEELMITNPDFSFDMLEQMSIAANNIIHFRFELGNKNLRGRIATVILEFSDKIYKSDIFNFPITRKEIGQLIDMSTENVIRILSEFRKDGIIEITGKQIAIKDKTMLNKIANKG